MWWTVQGKDLVLTGTTYADRDSILKIGNGVWSPKEYAWHFPATPAQIGRIVAVWPQVLNAVVLRDLAGQWQDVTHAQKMRRVVTGPPPTTTPMRHWKHQLSGYWWLKKMPTGGILAFDMGTGKTRVAFDIIQNYDDDGPVLVLAPKNVVGVWEEQASQYLQLGTVVYAPRKGTVAKRIESAQQFIKDAMKNGVRPVVILNYEAAIQPAAQKWLLSQQWAIGILDESHRIKNGLSATAKFVDKLRDHVTYRLAMTGTPMPHNRLDIWTQLRWVDPAVFEARFVAFRDRYAIRDYFGAVVGYVPQNEQEMIDRMAPYIYRVRSQDVLDLPEVVHTPRYVEMSKEGARAYHELENEFITGICDPATGELKKGLATNTLTQLLRLRQITSGFLGTGEFDTKEEIVFDHAKEEALADYLEDLPCDEPLVVFAQFRKDLDAIRRVVAKAGRPVFEVSGRVNSQVHLTAWKQCAADFNPKGAPVLAVQIQAGGLGIDLTAAHYAVVYSLDFNLGNYEQVMKRIHRGGQTKTTFYTHLIVPGTIDVTTYNALRAKKTSVQWLLNHFVQDVRGVDPDDGLSVAQRRSA
jgi:SNF2 family DNA or RNA helicase